MICKRSYCGHRYSLSGKVVEGVFEEDVLEVSGDESESWLWLLLFLLLLTYRRPFRFPEDVVQRVFFHQLDVLSQRKCVDESAQDQQNKDCAG